jgi:ribosomal protein S18 acetylase RimI-like enzyme
MRDIVTPIVLAGIGSIITYALQYAKRLVRERGLRKQYPVAGTFATAYDDIANDEFVTQKAFTRFTQRGDFVKGETYEFSSKRRWKLEGHVTRDGFLRGTYKAVDPYDSGSGTFFLKIDGTKGEMEGLWAGYDSANRLMGGGRYRFRRCAEARIRPARRSEADSLVALLGDAIGHRYVGMDEMEELIGGSADKACFVADLGGGNIAGAVTVRVVDREEAARELPKGQEALLDRLLSHGVHRRIGLIKAVAVHPGARKRGVATDLTRAALGWLADRNATFAFSIGWKSDKGCHVEGVFKSFEFQVVDEVAYFWREDSEAGDYRCPVCGEVCTCSAVVFTMSPIQVPEVGWAV